MSNPFDSSQEFEAQREKARQEAAERRAKQNWFARHWFISSLALLIGSYSFFTRDRTVRWEEEVMLNTGEKLIVKRSGVYEFVLLDAGDGRSLFYRRTDKQMIEFKYNSKAYRYSEIAVVQLIAIDPSGIPTLVARPYDWGYRNKFPCVTPYYVQFKPNSDGQSWTWPNQIEAWLYSLPTNLIIGTVDMADDRKKFKSEDRMRLNASILRYADIAAIDPLRKPQGCVERN